MMRTAILSLALLNLVACSGATGSDAGSGTTGGSGSSGGSSSGAAPQYNVTLASVGVHPAAVAALKVLGLTPPSLATGYHVQLQAVTLKAGSPCLTALGSVELTSANDTGPITFPNLSFADGIASLGLIAGIVADALPDAGTPAPQTGCTPPPASGPVTLPTCAQLAATPPTGFTDFYVQAGSQVYFGTPTADITDGVAFALPASYVAILDCAGGLSPNSASDLLNGGAALLYASAAASGGGAPLPGVTFSYDSGIFSYYPSGYAAGSASVNGPTSSNGVTTFTGVTTLAAVNATDTAGDKFNSRDLSAPAGSIYQVFYAPGT